MQDAEGAGPTASLFEQGATHEARAVMANSGGGVAAAGGGMGKGKLKPGLYVLDHLALSPVKRKAGSSGVMSLEALQQQQQQQAVSPSRAGTGGAADSATTPGRGQRYDSYGYDEFRYGGLQEGSKGQQQQQRPHSGTDHGSTGSKSDGSSGGNDSSGATGNTQGAKRGRQAGSEDATATTLAPSELNASLFNQYGAQGGRNSSGSSAGLGMTEAEAEAQADADALDSFLRFSFGEETFASTPATGAGPGVASASAREGGSSRAPPVAPPVMMAYAVGNSSSELQAVAAANAFNLGYMQGQYNAAAAAAAAAAAGTSGRAGNGGSSSEPSSRSGAAQGGRMRSDSGAASAAGLAAAAAAGAGGGQSMMAVTPAQQSGVGMMPTPTMQVHPVGLPGSRMGSSSGLYGAGGGGSGSASGSGGYMPSGGAYYPMAEYYPKAEMVMQQPGVLARPQAPSSSVAPSMVPMSSRSAAPSQAAAAAQQAPFAQGGATAAAAAVKLEAPAAPPLRLPLAAPNGPAGCVQPSVAVVPLLPGLPLPSLDHLGASSAVGHCGPQVLSQLVAQAQAQPRRKGKGGRQPAMDPRLDPAMDPKKAKRILANRQSAARSKMKQRAMLDTLKVQKHYMQMQRDATKQEIRLLAQTCTQLEAQNGLLSRQVAALAAEAAVPLDLLQSLTAGLVQSTATMQSSGSGGASAQGITAAPQAAELESVLRQADAAARIAGVQAMVLPFTSGAAASAAVVKQELAPAGVMGVIEGCPATAANTATALPFISFQQLTTLSTGGGNAR